MKIFFPNFLEKVVTFSYDDGVKEDLKLCEIFKNYELSATFNLNSNLFSDSRRLSIQEATKTYSNKRFEIAVHGRNHLSFSNLDKQEIIDEICLDKKNLEQIFDCNVFGVAYPYGHCNNDVKKFLEQENFVYGRLASVCGDFNLSKDFLSFETTCHHNDKNLFLYLEDFLDFEHKHKSLQVFSVWGHSYEFARDNNWNLIETFCQKISRQDKVWYATCGEIFNYINATKQLKIDYSKQEVYNGSKIDIYLQINDKMIISKSKEIKHYE